MKGLTVILTAGGTALLATTCAFGSDILVSVLTYLFMSKKKTNNTNIKKLDPLREILKRKGVYENFNI